MQLCNMTESNLAKPGIFGLQPKKPQILRGIKNKTTNEQGVCSMHICDKRKMEGLLVSEKNRDKLKMSCLCLMVF